MSARRPRLVIKPNIRPGIAKGPSAPKPKPAAPSTGPETSTVTKAPQTLTDLEKPALAKEDATTNNKSSDEKTKQVIVVPQTGASLEARTKSNISEPNNQTVQLEPDTEPQGHQQDLEESSVTVAETESATTTRPISEPTGILTSLKAPTSQHQPSYPLSSTAGTPSVSAEIVDVTDSAKTTEDAAQADGQDPGVEGSVVSGASSLEPDNERQAEVEEATEKKPKRQRTKKPNLDALPSRDKSPDRQKMKMSDLLLWNPERNFLPSKPKKKKNVKDENRPTTPESSVSVEEEADASKESENAALPAPQVMIGPDGNVVLNTESLLISTPEKDSQKSKIIVEEDDEDRYLNTNSYRKYHKKKFWSEDETDKFFIGLSMCGTDFSLLTKLMTNRSRRELKNKFRREEKYNRPRVDKSLANMQQYDPSVFVEKPPPPPKPKFKKPAPSLKKEKVEKKEKEKPSKAKESKSKLPAKKEAGPATKKAKKRKRPESSEDEEDDWGPEYDEITEEEELSSRIPAHKRPQRKAAAVGWKKEHMGEDEEGDEGETSAAGSPGLQGKAAPRVKQRTPARQTAAAMSTSSAAGRTTGLTQQTASQIQAIPGTTQVQIEVSGVETPVQGMLIPSHMVPTLAPQLGLGEGALGGPVQVLLVHEEAADGSLVHVYIIPEDRPPGAAGTSSAASTSGPASRVGNQPQVVGEPGQTVNTTVMGLASGQQQTAGPHPVSLVAAQARPAGPQAPFPIPGPSQLGATSPAAGVTRPQSQFPPTAGARARSPFPPTGMRSPFPPTAGVRSPYPLAEGLRPTSPFPPTGMRSPFPPTAGVRSPFPPTAGLRSTSPFPPTAGGVSPAQQHAPSPRAQSPFPPLPAGRKSFPPTPSPTNLQNPIGQPDASPGLPIQSPPLIQSPHPVGSPLPMSPPPLQGYIPLGRMPRPRPQIHPAQLPSKNIEGNWTTVKERFTPPSVPLPQHDSRPNPPVQNLMAAHAAVVEETTSPSSDRHTHNDTQTPAVTCTASATFHQMESVANSNSELSEPTPGCGTAVAINFPSQLPAHHHTGGECTGSGQTSSSQSLVDRDNPPVAPSEPSSSESNATSLAVTISEAQKTLLVQEAESDIGDLRDFAAVGRVEVRSSPEKQLQPQEQEDGNQQQQQE